MPLNFKSIASLVFDNDIKLFFSMIVKEYSENYLGTKKFYFVILR